MLHRMTLLALAAPGRIVACAVFVMIAAGLFGASAAGNLKAGGFVDPAAESAQATRILTDTFGQGDMQLVFTVTDPQNAQSAAARAVGTAIADRASKDPAVTAVASPWTAPAAVSGSLISTDGRSGLVVVGLRGGEDAAPRHAQRLAEAVAASRDGKYPQVDVMAGGSAMVFSQINSQTQRDVVVMESIAIPLTFVVLIWVFRGVWAALLPVSVGTFSIVGSLALLRVIASITDVSVFALSLSAALGLALAVDYTLLILSRYRDEIAAGAQPNAALLATMATAGRTVLFSALTVAMSMAALAVFPLYFLKSFAYAGVATVALCSLAAMVITPAAIVLLGSRLTARDAGGKHRRPDDRFWYRTTVLMTGRAGIVAVLGSAALLTLCLPFLDVRWGLPDERVLPTSASAHQVGDMLRSDFTEKAEGAIKIVVPDAAGLSSQDIDTYAMAVSQVRGVAEVSTPTAVFAAGVRAGPPAGMAAVRDGSAFLTVNTTESAFSPEAVDTLRGVKAVPGPGGRDIWLTGATQVGQDSVAAITSRLPVVLGIIAAVMFAVMFILTGSVVLPVKSLVLTLLSLTASFGALVWVFQEGHLGALGTTVTGTLVANMPILLFCIAFGLSMDYEVFIVARIREFWLASDRTRLANDEAVAQGLAHTGRVVTAAAAIMTISFGALFAAKVSFMRMFGVGLTLAIVLDATVVRMMLLPAFMHLLGRHNWWAPAPIARWHARIAGHPTPRPEPLKKEPIHGGVDSE
ncbi:membrane protein [Mycolicibacterium aromaticivorans JS19b1 = JCM 16368]|uniref:Membrane protein n=1 Tax=Mycolicibacterium aromaticivorans JS19b1 = JCM 16368 TaxID=1440774 RepID=A0A064CPT3_9MYCO|nr:MMPL family transporter [Mycolicibacterium aromaticivorans]KDF02341.1 membrane protein [Mycolicibacterium aromaticivorans JS19b1 = JCM 16368]